MQPISPDSPAMVPVARFTEREQAETFRAVAAECGVAARVSDVRRFSRIFDATLGGADSHQGFTVEVQAGEVPVLQSRLAGSLEIDPHDPMRTASREELRALVESPLDGNLYEKMIASEILGKLPPPENPAPPPSSASQDAHFANDRRMARWLGVTGIVFTLVYLAILAGWILSLSPRLSAGNYPVENHAGFGQTVEIHSGDIADNVRPFLLTLVPMATGAALILSWRPLRDGTRRRMFPAFWRITGHILFWLPVLLMGAGVRVILLHRGGG